METTWSPWRKRTPLAMRARALCIYSWVTCKNHKIYHDTPVSTLCLDWKDTIRGRKRLSLLPCGKHEPAWASAYISACYSCGICDMVAQPTESPASPSEVCFEAGSESPNCFKALFWSIYFKRCQVLCLQRSQESKQTSPAGGRGRW